MSLMPAHPDLIERLFARLSGMYGHRFTDMWEGIDAEVIKSTWAAGLAGFSQEEMVRGFEACQSRDWPPTLPEFRKLCRPPPAYEPAFVEAAVQIRKRDSGEDVWSHPSVYWAAVALGPDLRSRPYVDLRNRWQKCMDDAIADIQAGKRPAMVPQSHAALPAPGDATVSKATAKRHIDEMRRILGVAA